MLIGDRELPEPDPLLAGIGGLKKSLPLRLYRFHASVTRARLRIAREKKTGTLCRMSSATLASLKFFSVRHLVDEDAVGFLSRTGVFGNADKPDSADSARADRQDAAG